MYTCKPIKRRLIQHLKLSEWKANFLDGFWWPSWIYADF